MKRKILGSLIVILFLMSFATPSFAQSMSDASYKLLVNGQPMTDIMTVTPGQTLPLDTTVHFVFHKGSLPVSSVEPAVTANIDIYLTQKGNTIDHQQYTKTIGGVTINDGQPTDISTAPDNTIQYTVPATISGYCTLKFTAVVHADVMGLASYDNSQTKVVLLNVVAPTPTPGPDSTPLPSVTPTPTPIPQSTEVITINNSTVTRQADGTLKLNTTESKGTVTDTSGNTTKVAASVDVNLSSAPAGAQITTYLVEKPLDNTANTQFMLAAAESGADISDIACVLVVEHPALTNGKEIKNATITMKASESWVNAHGGVNNITILRYNNGVAENLTTTYVGRDPADNSLMIFQAVSPHGLSQFALAAVAKLPTAAGETVKSGVSVNSGSIIGIVAGIVIVLIVIIGGVFVVLRGRKKKAEPPQMKVQK